MTKDEYRGNAKQNKKKAIEWLWSTLDDACLSTYVEMYILKKSLRRLGASVTAFRY